MNKGIRLKTSIKIDDIKHYFAVPADDSLKTFSNGLGAPINAWHSFRIGSFNLKIHGQRKWLKEMSSSSCSKESMHRSTSTNDVQFQKIKVRMM